ncbi:Peroxyureidoacrylate/ureidoacrylate amidohydrolase RutB [Achromobacter anxifer]|uniref:cysteine hydrolase family protein n=1 Tax=Achromobacter anxifer TaxID=1287737 RepID=UPI00155CF87B|nr:cysteine hydrolase family protein [Achromobacter anxifer]CAB5512077.1 Peroxyureidoacrylate/ureidoacrylate amidohydrolase RutB [Achromobacter anxifer]
MTSALIVIDVQRALFETSPAPADAEAVLARINELAARAREAGVPVIYVQHESPGSAMDHGLAGWQLDPRLQAADGDIRVRKTTPDSFLRTGLADALSQAGATGLVICGYASEFCVDTTVRRAAALGHPVTLAADAHTTHDKPHAAGAQIRVHHNATLSSISSFGVKIAAVPAADIVFDGAERPHGS